MKDIEKRVVMKKINILRSLCILIALAALPGCAFKKSSSPCAPTQQIDDFSRLNKTDIAKLVCPTSYEEIHDIIIAAKEHHQQLSISGIRHSQGGHAFYHNAIVINMAKLNNVIHFDPKGQTITVQTGITWREVQDYINPHNLAVKTMQIANLFTIGGSLSVNCNGIDPHYGPLIESVISLKIMLPDGSIVNASRTENKELFSLAIGGYGLFGIILEATFSLTENYIYNGETPSLSLEDYVTFIKENPKPSLHFGFLTINLLGKKLFSKVKLFNFYPTDSEKLSPKRKRRVVKLHQEPAIQVELAKIHTYFWSQSKFIKALHWVPLAIKYGGLVSRSNVMRPPASHLYVESKKSTNMVEQYFIPVDNLISFIDELERISRKLHINIMNVNFRFIPKNTESFLSYTHSDCIGIAIFFNQKLTPAGDEKTKLWTQHLINTAIDLHGAYYLVIKSHATQEQIRQVYPKLDMFFALKKQYDPNEIFVNHFYKKYKE